MQLVALDMAAAFKVRCEPGSSHLLAALRPGPMVDCGRDGEALPEMIGRERMWKLVSTGTGMLCGLLARKLLRTGYTVVRRDAAAPSPFDPTKARFSWPDALLWAVAAGIGLGVAKVVSARVAVFGWKAATGTVPPGVAAEPAVS